MADDGKSGMPRLREGIDLIATRWGPMYGFTNDRGVSEALRRFGEYATFEIGLYDRLLEPGDVFVDVGSNIGVIARAVASAPAQPTVIGFESQPDCYRLASANTFHYGNVSIYPLAVSDRESLASVGEIDLRRWSNYGGIALADGAESPRRVPCPTITLDRFLPARAPRPRLVKIDTEGMEAAVLRGLTGLLHDRLVVSAEADRHALVPDVLSALQAMRCTCFAAFFRPIAPDNPRHDPASVHCRTIHVHLLGFASRPPAWITRLPGIWPVAGMTDFDRLWRKYLPVDAAPR